VLSQYPFQHRINLRQTYPTALYQTANQLDVTNRCTVNYRSAIVVAFFILARFQFCLTAAGVQILFLFLTLFGPIIFGASFDGIFPPVRLPAAERTAKIITPCIPGMGEK